MDIINNNKLVNVVSYFIIIFALSIILYLMYIDFLSETFFSNITSKEKYTDLDIDKKINYINQIKEKKSQLIEGLTTRASTTDVTTTTSTAVATSKNSLDLLAIDINLPYILKKDLMNSNNENAITNASCSFNDKSIEFGNTCIISPNNFYLPSSGNNNFTISVMPDGQSDRNTNNQRTYFNYDVNIVNIQPNAPLSIIRQTYFFFPDDKNIKLSSNAPRLFDYTNKYDMSIVNYFNNYTKYNNKLDTTKYNQLFTGTYNNADMVLIDTYFSYISNLLLLKSTNVDTKFIYKSNYDFDVNDIKQNIIFLYNVILQDSNNTVNVNLVIDDGTNIKFYFDSPVSNNIYTFELNPKIKITFSKLNLQFDPNMPKHIIKSSIWALHYLVSLTADTNAPDVTFNYNDTIYYPIVLPLAVPIINNWDTNPNNGILPYMGNIFNSTKTNILNINLTDPLHPQTPVYMDGLALVTQNLSYFVKILGNTHLLKITDIFVLFDPETLYFQSWILTDLIDKHTQEHIICPLISFTAKYSPSECTKGTLYNSKCLPSCPAGFSYDLGLVCLNNNYTNYLPRSPMCNYINSLILPDTSINPIIQGIKTGCDPNYFTTEKLVYQTDVTQLDFSIPSDITAGNITEPKIERFDNVNENKVSFWGAFNG